MLEKLKQADIPQELVLGWPRSVLLGDEKLIVEQHQGVYACTQQEIILKTNALRAKHGQRELVVNARLMEAAQVRAAELAATGTYAHTRPDGRKFTTVTDCPYVGENIHRISTSYLDYYHLDLAQAAIEDWAASQGHLENIINPEICAIGTGVARGKNNKGEEAWYCVQLFLVDGCSIGWVDQPMTGK